MVTHNDDVFGYLLSYLASFEFASHHFGWRKNYDPFSKNNAPRQNAYYSSKDDLVHLFGHDFNINRLEETSEKLNEKLNFYFLELEKQDRDNKKISLDKINFPKNIEKAFKKLEFSNFL